MPPGRGIVCSSCAVALAAAVALVACKQGDSSSAGSGSASGEAATRDPVPPPPPPPAPSIAIEVADTYRLSPAHAAQPLPAAPAAYVFVPIAGPVRVGTTPAFADATEAADDAALAKLLPPRPQPGFLDVDGGVGAATDPGGGGTGQGTIGTGGFPGGAGPGGMGYGYRAGPSAAYLDVRRVAPDQARLVLVADQATTSQTVSRLLSVIGEPVAVAVDDDGAAAGLAVQVGPFGRPSRGGDDVALDASFEHDDRLTAMVAALDAVAGRPGPVQVRVMAPGRIRGIIGPEVRIGQASAVGDLDKNIIRRYIKRNINRIKYCYEKQLLVTPKLEGTVTAEFVITAQGTVATASATGVDPEVASCVAAVIKAIEFPRPKGGGIVKVTYPFTFRATGG
jgi:hypothetical protein